MTLKVVWLESTLECIHGIPFRRETLPLFTGATFNVKVLIRLFTITETFIVNHREI